jgi:LysM repeat protein
MNQRSKAPARLFATIALVAAFVVLAVAIGASLDDDSTDSNGKRPAGEVTTKAGHGKQKVVTAAYVVQNGDTLTSIAHKTGVPVSQIEELNPGLDPQILVSGERLKLR